MVRLVNRLPGARAITSAGTWRKVGGAANPSWRRNSAFCRSSSSMSLDNCSNSSRRCRAATSATRMRRNSAMVFQEPPKNPPTSCRANCSDENTLRPMRSDAAATGRCDRIIMIVPSASRTTRTTPARWRET